MKVHVGAVAVAAAINVSLNFEWQARLTNQRAQTGHTSLSAFNGSESVFSKVEE